MSNTYKTKNYFKARNAWRRGEDPTGISEFWDTHKYGFLKTSRDSKLARYIIQTLGHRRRRSAERKVYSDVKCAYNHEDEELLMFIGVHDIEGYLWSYPAIESMEYEKYLSRKFSNPWDYY